METENEKRLRQQIEQYRTVENIHELPEIFHYWSNRYLRPRIETVFGSARFDEIIATEFAAAATVPADRPTPPRFLSIGAGDGTLETAVAQRLQERGLATFAIDCLELSSHLIERGRARAEQAGVGAFLRFVECDLNHHPLSGPYAGVMVHHSLHHIVNLEGVLEQTHAAMLPEARFVVMDMIGRNGHMRWPETLRVVEGLWPLLPTELKYNHQLSRYEESYINHDCSTEGFEGIRAQDIMPLLVQRFFFEKLVAFGGLIDIFIDRGFGHNFHPDSALHKAWIDFIEQMNETLLDTGVIKPTQLIAVLRKTPVSSRYWGRLNAEFSVRPPSAA